jgi:hypothetical protein
MDEPRAQPASDPTPATVEGMRKTVPQDAFSAEGLRAHLARTGPTGAVPVLPDPRAGTTPMLERPSLAERLRRFGGRAPGPPQARFEVERVLGVGATARVYAVLDRNLARAVAVKFLNEGIAGAESGSVEHFVQEAQITASLEHPNVLPVHELDINDAGQVYFTMKKIDGRSLGALIEQSSPRHREAPLDDHNAVVNVVIGVCQALAYAHARGIVHQDVKPENIMLGDFGEVLLVDWGSAARIRTGEPPRLYGTPLYMSPEQARREGVDERSDVYCVGATLFHALTLRPPTWSDYPEEFWRLKREGAIQAPTVAERAAIPRPLLDIALKAMAADAMQRYAGASELLADLRSYQGGLAVSAHRDTWLEVVARWHRRHWRALWIATAVAAVVITLGAALYGERLKEMATWGAPVLEERFADGSWKDRWQVIDGSFESRDGRLVSTGSYAGVLLCPRKLWGAAAIEYEAEILPDAQPGDISVFWRRDLPSDQKEPTRGAFTLQVGAFDGAYSAIRGTDGGHLASAYFRPEPGRRYRIRAEVDDYRLTLSVDGKVICQWTDAMRFDGGYLGLYTFYSGKAFEDVRIYSRGVAQKVPATAIGDALMRLTASSDPKLRGEVYDQAYEQYERVVASQPGTAVAREARYKQGLCRWEQQRYDDAFEAWKPLSGSEYDLRVRLYRIDRHFDLGDHDGALAELEEVARGGAEARRIAAMRWGRCVVALSGAGDRVGVEHWLAGHDRAFPDEQVVDVNAADALCFLGRNEELLRRYPQQRRQCAWALIGLARAHEVVERYRDQVMPSRFAMFNTGEFAEVERLGGVDQWFMDDIRVKTGRAAEVVSRHPKGIEYWMALTALGREQESIADAASRDPDLHARALMDFGREDEAARFEQPFIRLQARLVMGEPATVFATADPNSRTHRYAQLMLGIAAFARGDREEGSRLCAAVPTSLAEFDGWIFARLALPILEHPHDAEAWSRALAPVLADRWSKEQRPWYLGSWLAGQTSDAAFLAQPYSLQADARLQLLRGLRADHDEKVPEALAAYRAWLALPRWRRELEPQPVMEYFVQSRLQALSQR